MVSGPRPEGSNWFIRVLVALDQLLNTLLNGYPDETLSSRAGKALLRIEAGDRRVGDWFWISLCNTLHIFDKYHCVKNIETDEGK